MAINLTRSTLNRDDAARRFQVLMELVAANPGALVVRNPAGEDKAVDGIEDLMAATDAMMEARDSWRTGHGLPLK